MLPLHNYALHYEKSIAFVFFFFKLLDTNKHKYIKYRVYILYKVSFMLNKKHLRTPYNPVTKTVKRKTINARFRYCKPLKVKAKRYKIEELERSGLEIH